MIIVYENLMAGVKERQKLCEEKILAGVFSSFDEYKMYTGKLKGLKEAEDTMRSVFRKIYYEDK